MKKIGIIALIALCVLGCKKSDEPELQPQTQPQPEVKDDPVQEPQPVEFDTPTWKVKSDIDYSSMTVIMALPSDIVCDTLDMIAVFTNDDSECLAVGHPTLTSDSRLLGFLVVVAPSTQDNCYLKYYHKATRHMYTTATSALVFDNDARIGSLDEPKEFVWNIIKK